MDLFSTLLLSLRILLYAISTSELSSTIKLHLTSNSILLIFGLRAKIVGGHLNVAEICLERNTKVTW